MASPSNTPIPSTRRYPWDEWLDGRTWTLEAGVDFDAGKHDQMAAMVHQAARRRGLKSVTRFDNTTGMLRIKAEVP